METTTIPQSAFTNIVWDYADAHFKSRALGNSYWQGREDALMQVINYGWGYTSLQVQEMKIFKDAYSNIELAFRSNTEV